jgi:hypothetical protein
MMFAIVAAALAATAPGLEVPLELHGDEARVAQAVPKVDDGGSKKGGGVKKDASPIAGVDDDFMGRFFPFSVNEGAAKPVADNVVLVHVLGCLPFGGLWAPLVVYPSEGKPQLASDQLISWLVPFGITIGAVFLINAIFWIPSFIFPPCALLGCISLPVGIAGWWVSNNASMNAWDRAYKGRPIAQAPGLDAAPSRRAVAMVY